MIQLSYHALLDVNAIANIISTINGYIIIYNSKQLNCALLTYLNAVSSRDLIFYYAASIYDYYFLVKLN
jgi:hypothetical protein